MTELETPLRQANQAYSKLLDRMDAERNIGTHQRSRCATSSTMRRRSSIRRRPDPAVRRRFRHSYHSDHRLPPKIRDLHPELASRAVLYQSRHSAFASFHRSTMLSKPTVISRSAFPVRNGLVETTICRSSIKRRLTAGLYASASLSRSLHKSQAIWRAASKPKRPGHHLVIVVAN